MGNAYKALATQAILVSIVSVGLFFEFNASCSFFWHQTSLSVPWRHYGCDEKSSENLPSEEATWKMVEKQKWGANYAPECVYSKW